MLMYDYCKLRALSERDFDDLTQAEQDQFFALSEQEENEKPAISMWADDHII